MSQDVNDGNADQGGPDEGSSPSEQMVPLSVMLAERSKFEDRMATKVAELEGKLTAAATKPVKEFTRAELQQQVDDGRMNPEESDRILHDQMKRTIKAEVTSELSATAAAETRVSKVNAEIKRYTDHNPDILLDGTETRSLVNAEFMRQVNDLGKPNDAQTELDALMAVYGPSGMLQNAKTKERQTHQDVGSDGGESSGVKDGAPKDMPRNVKDHYEGMIAKGMYKGWDDPNLKSEVENFGARWK